MKTNMTGRSQNICEKAPIKLVTILELNLFPQYFVPEISAFPYYLSDYFSVTQILDICEKIPIKLVNILELNCFYSQYFVSQISAFALFPEGSFQHNKNTSYHNICEKIPIILVTILESNCSFSEFCVPNLGICPTP